MKPLRAQARESRTMMWKSLLWATLTWAGLAASSHWIWILILVVVSGMHVVGAVLWRQSEQKWLALAAREEELDRRIASQLAYSLAHCEPRGNA